MKPFAEKVAEARKLLGISQIQLAEKIGTSNRTISSYEISESRPHRKMLLKLAEALEVSPEYLENDEIEDPMYGIEKTPYIEEARSRFGNKAAKEMDELFERNRTLFAGGALSQEAKDSYFEALMRTYLDCKAEAKLKFGRKEEKDV